MTSFRFVESTAPPLLSGSRYCFPGVGRGPVASRGRHRVGLAGGRPRWAFCRGYVALTDASNCATISPSNLIASSVRSSDFAGRVTARPFSFVAELASGNQQNA